MKKLFTLLATLVALCSYAQTPFRTGITAFDYTEFYDVVQLNDGSYVCIGNSESDKDYAYVVKSNVQGQLMASKTLLANGDGYSEAFDIIKTSDGNIAVSGTLDDQIALFKFDLNLNLIWSKKYSISANFSGGTRLIQTSDGGYMMAGYFDDNNDESGCIIKTTSDGTVSWIKQYTDASATGSYIIDIVDTKDGNYAFMAEFYDFDDFDGERTYLVKMNNSGNVIWSKYVTTTAQYQSPISLVAASDGGLVVCGTIAARVNENYTNEQAMVVKFTQDGTIAWAKTTDNGSTMYDTYLWGMIEDSDGGYVISGDVYNADENNTYLDAFYLVKINNSGTVQWTKNFPDANINGYFYGITRTSDGGYAACGSVYNNSNGGDFGALYKFSSGLSICGESSPFGTFTNLAATAVTSTLSVSNVTATTAVGDLTISTAGTFTNLCLLLPAQLLSFNATLQNKAVQVQWKTANETNTDHFVVERSSNSTSFQAVQQVKAAGNSSSAKTYAITDAQPLFGTSYYRLKLVDKDGSFTYSPIASVTVSANGTMVISPNPVHNNINLLLQSAASGNAKVLVTDMNGKVVINQQAAIVAGSNRIIIPAASLNKGLYILKLVQNSTIQSSKFIKE